MERLERILEWGGMKRDIGFLAVSGAALLGNMLGLPDGIVWIAILLCGIPIILEAAISLITEFDIKADLLVSLALVASVVIGELFAAGEVAFIMQLGGLLEELTVAKARAGIEKLVKLTPRTARVLENGEEKEVPAEQVLVGQRLRVLPGETVPVDGVILSGQTAIDEAVMTGESLPVDKTVGDEVSSGTVNRFGAFEMEAVHVGEDSAIQRMIRLVQSADAGKAKIVGMADRWATWIVVIALTAAALTWLISGEILRAVTILVVFCPCSLVLATPTAIMAAIGNATRHGFLIREGDALERLAGVKFLTFDKTGTLTLGVPSVVKIESIDPRFTSDAVYAMAAAVEQNSEHPLGRAVVRSWKEKIARAEDFAMIPGQGAVAKVEGRRVAVGNGALFQAENISAEALTAAAEASLQEGCSIIYVAVDGAPAGYLALSDLPRTGVDRVIRSVEQAEVRPVLLTGDHPAAASHIASVLGIPEFRAECLPEDKLTYIDSVQRQGGKLCMVGDGINDAPALKKADVGIAMGGNGSDIAVEAADLAIVHDDLTRLPHLFSLSRRMMKTIHFNLSFSMLLNLLAIVLAITGILNPVVGALVHNAGSVFVILNSALLLRWSDKSAVSE